MSGKQRRAVRFIQSEFKDRKKNNNSKSTGEMKDTPVHIVVPIEKKREVKAQIKMDNWESQFDMLMS